MGTVTGAASPADRAAASGWWAARIATVRAAVEAWAPGRMALPRVGLLLILAWLALPLVTEPEATGWFGPINLAIHEIGHLVLRLTGVRFIEILGGTLAQLIVPVAMLGSFLRQGDLFAPSFAGFWLGVNLCNISVYMGDARAQALPLVSVGFHATIIHDWNYLLGALGLLRCDRLLAGLTHLLALVVIAGSLAYGFWVCRLIQQSGEQG